MCSELGKLFGFEEAGGVFCPGGSYSNMHAMLTARNVAFPDFVKVQ
jgi:glutamate/tyrosine decarboxylase-like PLP-dependent enzyme